MFCAEGDDFADPLSGFVELVEEDSVQEVLIPVFDDTVFEGPTNENFSVRISLPSCPINGMLSIENAESIVSIEDNDIKPGTCILYTLQ